MTDRKKRTEHITTMNDVDRIVHEPSRYIIMAYLYVVDKADFLFLLRQTGLTKGNLSAHLIKLEKVSYVHVEKKFSGRIPKTVLRLTKKGRIAFDAYRSTMKKALDDIPV